MADLTIGTAPDSWGVWFPSDERQVSWSRYLDEAAQAGYRWTELGPYGYLPDDAGRLERELSRRQLRLASGFVMLDLEDPRAWAGAAAQVQRTCALVEALGAEVLVVIDDVYTDLFTGVARREPVLDDQQWRILATTIERIREVADRHGLSLAFHPHAQCHVETEQQIERLLDLVPELPLCLDVGHHAYCGGDPVAFLCRHADRIRYLHLKNVDSAIRGRVERDGLPFARAVAEGVFVEPGVGAVDFEALRDAIGTTGYRGFAVVEQDMYPTAFDRPLPIATRTYAYLTELGFT